MRALQENIFNGGLNSDDEERLIPQGDYTYALNVRNTSTNTNDVGVITNVKGTEEKISLLKLKGENRGPLQNFLPDEPAG